MRGGGRVPAAIRGLATAALCAALGGAAAATPGAAQVTGAEGDPGAAPGAPPLTLDEALSIARRANPTFQQAATAVELNGVETRSTWANQVLPSVNLNLLRTGYGGFLTRRAFDFFGNPIENPQADWVYNSNTSQGVTLNWQIRGTSLFDAAKRQAATNLQRDLSLGVAAWQLDAEVRRRFFEALEQRELFRVEEAIVETRQVDFESAQRLFRIGQRSRVDVLTAELQVEQQRLTAQQQRRAYQRSTLALRTYLGDPSLESAAPADTEVPVFDPATLDDERLVALAREWNPGLREQEAAVTGARVSVREARQDWFPQLNVNFDYGRLAQTQEAGALLDLQPEESEWQSSFNISLSLPALNDFFGTRAEQAQARVDVIRQEETLRERRLQVEEQVRSQLIELRNQYQSLQLAGRSLEIAGEAVRLAREEYRLGTRTFEQLQEAVTQEADARRQVIQARFGFVDALLTLEEAVGQRVSADFTLPEGG